MVEVVGGLAEVAGAEVERHRLHPCRLQALAKLNLKTIIIVQQARRLLRLLAKLPRGWSGHSFVQANPRIDQQMAILAALGGRYTKL